MQKNAIHSSSTGRSADSPRRNSTLPQFDAEVAAGNLWYKKRTDKDAKKRLWNEDRKYQTAYQRPAPSSQRSELQRAIQETVPHTLSSKELYEVERNLVGLFEVLLKINLRERLVDTPGLHD